MHKLDQVMNGEIEDIVSALNIAEQAELMDKGE
jgi:peptide chain release factor 1